jgi:hypothetical protein
MMLWCLLRTDAQSSRFSGPSSLRSAEGLQPASELSQSKACGRWAGGGGHARARWPLLDGNR